MSGFRTNSMGQRQLPYTKPFIPFHSFNSFKMMLIVFVFIMLLSTTTIFGLPMPMPTRSFSSQMSQSLLLLDQPVEIVRRLPVAVVHSSKHSAFAFLQMFGVMTPAMLVWKLADLHVNGWRVWAETALKMGLDWGIFSAFYTGGEKFFERLRNSDDKFNQYLSCGICSAITRVKEGPPAMITGFVTGFAFVYVLEVLTELSGVFEGKANDGRETIEGTLATKTCHKKFQHLGAKQKASAATTIGKTSSAARSLGKHTIGRGGGAGLSSRLNGGSVSMNGGRYSGGYYEFARRSRIKIY